MTDHHVRRDSPDAPTEVLDDESTTEHDRLRGGHSSTEPRCSRAAPARKERAKTTGAGGRIEYLNFGDFGGGAAPKPNYNPYLDAGRSSSATLYMFETLYIVEGNSCEEKPWLADSYKWQDANDARLRHASTA